MWLPRFIDKVRHHLAGTLADDFVRPFCHPLATDGVFLHHFRLEKDAVIAVISDAPDDAAVAAWFTARPEGTADHIAAWNALAPRLGLPGTAMERGFRWALRHYYGGDNPDPRVQTVFAGLAWDEGYLDEMPLPLLP